ncbi:uncharacterized protein LOC123522880 isoform X2 [Mercenaria mercenaria]|uniref:uncharacterized protein LOC123522880 isoform X2 n=1 Tax=Mercenaria mercenaria TaxID=6596 RepID=UPI00234E70A4|nr:uncharacterized protein LOC123522880 isoform X2 [Mercenaria mercenaria]
MLRSLKESMTDLKTRTRGLKQYAELFKQYLKEQYQIPDGTTQFLDAMNWMNQEDMIINGAAIKKPNEVFKSHYHLLSVFGLYVKQLRTNGTLAVKKNEDETRKKLYNLETKIYNCMCNLKIALQSSGSDVTRNVTNDILDPNFMANSSPLMNAIYRAYITMKDGINLMEFLNIIYQKVEESIMTA